MYQIFEHTADLGIRVSAADLNGLFRDAGKALVALLVGNSHDIQPQEEARFELSAEPIDFLFRDWLAELLFTFDSRRLLLPHLEVHIDGSHLKAVGRGEYFDLHKHEPGREIKAITYHGLKVEQFVDEWQAEVIIDI